MGLDFDIKELIKPYVQGGTESNPVNRSLDTISNALINRYKFPQYISALAVWKIFYMIANEGLKFKGDGSYGSKGRELFSAIKSQCVEMLTENAKTTIKKELTKKTVCFRFDCSKRTMKFKRLSKWKRFFNFMMKARGIWLY